MLKTWFPLITTFAIGLTVGLAVGYSKPQTQDHTEEPHEIFVGQCFRVIVPGPPGSKDFEDYSLRIVRIHHTEQQRTREDDQFGTKNPGWRLVFFDRQEAAGFIAFAEPK